MGLFNWLGSPKDLSEPIKAVGDLYTTDKARLEAQAKLEDVMQKPVLAQTANNMIMSGSTNWFANSWQPLIGWSAGFLVLLYYAPQILIIMYVWGSKCINTGIVTQFPMRPDDILNLVWLLFGFGGYHLGKKAIAKI